MLIGSALITMDSAVSGLSALSGIGAALEEQGLDGEAQARIVHQVTKQVPLQRLCEAINGAGRDLWNGLQAGGVSLPSISRALAAIMSAGDSPQTRSTAVRLCFLLLRIPDCPVRDWRMLHGTTCCLREREWAGMRMPSRVCRAVGDTFCTYVPFNKQITGDGPL